MADDAVATQLDVDRVLLTRARYETVIWIPRGDPADATRDPPTFDAIARFLAECGAQTLEEPHMTAAPAEPLGTLL